MLRLKVVRFGFEDPERMDAEERERWHEQRRENEGFRNERKGEHLEETRERECGWGRWEGRF